MLLGEPQLQALALAAVREDGHLLASGLRLHHHLDGDVLVGEVAASLRAGMAVAGELQRRSLLHSRLVGLAHHLEVGGGLQVVVLYVFREVEDDVVAGAQDAVLGLGCAEELRAARVLHAGEHLRLRGEERISVPAEEHGAKVVALLHHRTLAEEAGHDVAVLGNHGLRAAGSAVERRVGIVATQVGPVVVAARGLLVLELYMVEVVLVLVEAVDDHGQIPALALLLRRVAVHDPLVAGRRDGDGACRLQVVYVEGHLRVAVHVFLRDDADAQSLVVELLAGIDIKRLLRHLSRMHLDGA